MALRQRSRRPRHVGELLPVRSLSEEGLLVRDDGALVRFVDVIPGNPLVLDVAGCERMTRGFTDLLLAVPAGMSVQMYAEGTNIALEELLHAVRRETDTATAPLVGSPDPAQAARGRALRALAEIHQESLVTHAEQQAALQVRFVLVVPFLPQVAARDPTRPPLRLRRRSAGSPRAVEQQLSLDRDSLTYTEQLRGALSALDVRATLMTGPQVADLLWRRLAPQTARTLPHQRPSHRPATPLGRPGQPADAGALQEALCQGAVDLGDARRVTVDGDLEHTFYVAARPERTFYGWLLHAMQSTKPWTLSVHVHLRDRVEMRAAFQRQERRIAGVNQGAHDTGRRPDRDQLRQEAELQALVDHDLATGAESICDISIYQSIREPGPDPDPHELDVDAIAAMRALGGAVDAPINRGELQQVDLLRSTLPLGLDFARRTFRAVTRNAADCTPFVSTRCGSPDGLPLGFAAPGRTLERLQPFDPVHDNAVTLVFAKSGGGKTATVIALLTAALPRGAQVTVLDRSRGHYAFPCQLVPGAAHLEPAADLPHAPVINPWDTPDPAAVPKRKIAFLVRLHALLIGDHDAATDHYGLTPLQRALLAAAIRDVYAHAAHSHTTPTESALRAVLLDRAKREATDDHGAAEVVSALRSLARALEEFCADGTYGPLLDRPTALAADDAPLLVFNTHKVPDDLNTAVVFIALEHTISRVEARFEQHVAAVAAGHAPAGVFDGASIVVLEEVWKLVRHRATREWVIEQAKRARHLGLWLIAITQQRSDLHGPEANALLVNSSTQLFLRLGADELAHLSDVLELSSEERQQIKHLTTEKRSHAQVYLINGERGRGTLTIRHGTRLYWLTTSEPHDDLPLRHRALQAAGDEAADDDETRAAAGFAALELLADRDWPPAD